MVALAVAVTMSMCVPKDAVPGVDTTARTITISKESISVESRKEPLSSSDSRKGEPEANTTVQLIDSSQNNPDAQPSEDAASAVESQSPIQTELPFCESGNHFLSLEAGGAWIDTGVVHQPLSRTPPENEHRHLLCYEHEGYKDTFQWQPPCRSRALPTQESTSSATRSEWPPSIEEAEQRPLQVLLWGDSLQYQIMKATQLRPKDYIPPKRSIQYKIKRHHEVYFVRSSHLIFKSPKSSHCQRKINHHPENFYMEEYASEQELVASVFGNKTYDYIFFNEFAHHGHLTNRIRRCYQAQGLTHQDVLKDALVHFTREMRFIARILRQYFPTTRVYFRTSSPQVYKWAPAEKPLKRVPHALRSFGYADCVDTPSQQNLHLWRCVPTYNAIATAAFVRRGHAILDTAPAMSLRVDAHPCSNQQHRDSYVHWNKSHEDCNHFCAAPGPPDVMVQAMEAEIFAREYEKQQQEKTTIA